MKRWECRGPVLIEAVCGSHGASYARRTLRWIQALKFAEALARGTPNRKKLVLTALSGQRCAELV